MSDVNSELQNWKNKYFDALGELESKEKAWNKTEQFLRQGLSHLTLAADTSDEMLNRRMEQLRGLLRTGNNDQELHALLDSISESIRQMDETRKAREVLPKPGELLEDVVGRITFPRGMGHRAKALQKQMLQAAEADYPRLIEELVNLIVDALRWVAEDASSLEEKPVEKSGLFGKLFSREDKAAAEVQAKDSDVDALAVAKKVLQEMIDELIAPQTERQALTSRLEQSQREMAVYAMGRELVTLLKPLAHGGGDIGVDEELPPHEVLLRLIERIDVPAELGDEVEAIKSLLADSHAPATMEKAIVAIAELVGEMRDRVQNEKGEIESFLKQMTERLQEIDITFQQNVATQRESYAGGRELDRAVHDQVQGIEETVSQAQDIELLKVTLQQRVDTIRNHMQEFRQAEELRLERAEQQVEKLTERLQSVQQESDGLRKRLKEERDLAMVDPLTGIPNRFAYNERLQQEVARWRRYQSPLVLAVWDVDRFKSINDTFGHQAGDKVLTVIAKLLHKQVRETDFVARYGGEEFVLLLPETELENAAVVTEQIRKSVESCEFHFRGDPVPITISCGMSEFRDGDSAEQVFSRADAALYKAKENGRNQCRSA